ncbi:MAG: LemA family protein [Candidatus Omnitrophica bacterium]|nr:LemA family protein [Candidatus Omnitrophota bacterium]
MESKARIQKMLKDGKINARQSQLLQGALAESEKRKIQIFQNVSRQKESREKKMWGGITIGLIGFFLFLVILFFFGVSMRMGRDFQKATLFLDQGTQALYHGDLQTAKEHFIKARRKAPRHSLTNGLLAATYKVLYQYDQDPINKQMAEKYYIKTQECLRQKGGGMMNMTGFIFLMMFVLFILTGISVLLLVLYNILVKREEKVNESWAQIAVLYQRKLDLIPALLEAAREYAKHEQSTLQDVISARSQVDQVFKSLTGLAVNQDGIKDITQAERALDTGLGKIYALAEKYPDLKANIHFETIIHQLTETEDRVAQSRNKYNTNVKKYNADLRLFPMNIMAALCQFARKNYLELEIA